MKDNPVTPGVSVVVLEWNVTRNDTDSYEESYLRIKILNEDGKKHADIEIPFVKGQSEIRDLKARTIRPDGTIVPFVGKPFEKTIVKGRQFKVLAKTFTFPEVAAGCILEYRYKEEWDANRLFQTRWVLQLDKPVVKARFKLMPYDAGLYATSWSSFRLPIGKEVKRKGGNIELELENIPAFDDEDYSPPEDELKARVEFIYSVREVETEPAKFWQRVAKESYEAVEDFIGKRKAIQQHVETLISSGDPGEVKLRKLYVRAQQVHNRSYDRDLTEQEEKRSKLKSANNVEDTLRNGYGYARSINRFFIAMARAAGFEAYAVTIGERDNHFLNPQVLKEEQLDGEIAYVKADGKEYYLDPGTVYCPFGMLAWRKTGVRGIILSKNNSSWIVTPQPDVRDAVTRRVAQLAYADGIFKGEIAVSYDGQEALDHRIDAITQDEKEFQDDQEKDLKERLPEGSTVRLKAIQSAKDPEKPFAVVFTVEIPDFTSSAGSRRLVPLSIFGAATTNPFRYEKRVHPVYFNYPFQELDTVVLEIPLGYKVENLPQETKEQPEFGMYQSVWKMNGTKIVYQRLLAMMGVFFRQEHYPKLRGFFDKVNSTDQETAVLRSGAN
ncbi:MAG: DUF3857 domain-containing protein [Acidobacteriales bacterium]|nr:DUF3857 domain-containing protein [Terriglobales bacterium]